MIAGNRAQIIGLTQSPVQNFGLGLQPIVSIEVKNTGGTPAYHCSYETWIEVLGVPFQDFTSAADYYKAPFLVSVYPNSPMPLVVNVTLQHPLTLAEFQDFPPGKKSLCFRIRIEYTDVYGKRRWYELGQEFTGQRMGALPKYNDAN